MDTCDPTAGEMHGNISQPFQPGEHRRIGVKVIDFPGDEVGRVVNLDSTERGGGA